ncbi:MAG: ATP-binding protein [Myxococcaceae bacterium]|nr:ATP-binding protein [Myxococcaceae bacterium]MCI0672140.1 ATP-binding protein [Myxococcaceae bacterium]
MASLLSQSTRTGPALAVARGQAHPPVEAMRADFSWLLRLRWGAMVGHAAVLATIHWGMGVALPLVPLLVLLVLGAASNVALNAWLRSGVEVSPRALAVVMHFDAAVLTGLLALSGGPFNPFSILYVVNVALAAILLPSRACWMLAAVSLALFGALFLLPEQGPFGLALPDHASLMRLHLHGMWVAFAVAAGFVVFFVQRVTRAMAAQQEALAAARSLQARHERVAGLATLAAGTAHELSTPLSTIAVASAELERALSGLSLPAEVREDVALIRSQVRRCRDVLHHMSDSAGQPLGEPLVTRTLAAWVQAAMEGLPGAEQVQCPPARHLSALRVRGPARALDRALRGLVKNALQASPPGTPVVLTADEEGGTLTVTVHDAGPGLPPEVRARAGEPFFTTKAPGEGMGLGLFLTRTLLEPLGGVLELGDSPHGGCAARLRLPRASVEAGR